MSRKTTIAVRYPPKEEGAMNTVTRQEEATDNTHVVPRRDESNKALYSTSCVRMPTISQLKKLAKECGYDLTEEELKVYSAQIQRTGETLNEINRLPELTLPVKYQRTPGHKPSAEENPYNAWSHVCTIQGARHGKLHGKRIAVKDNIAVAGVPMMDGCYALQGYVPDFDATVVTRVLDAGATVCGKATCEDLCYSGGSFTGAGGPVLNPHDPTRNAGGSSSGCAAAIVAGDVDMALGTDQGGSIRIPSAWCGVVGLKPTYGLVPYTGIMSFEPTVDHVGPMAKTVDDCALLLESIAGYDNGYDHRQHPGYKVPEYLKELENCHIDGVRVGILTEGFCEKNSEARVNQRVLDTVNALRNYGAKVGEASVPQHRLGGLAFSCFAKEGFNEAMNSNGGGGYGLSGFYPSSMMAQVGMALGSRPNDMSHRNKVTRLIGEHLKRNYQGKFYAKGRNLVLAVRQAYDHAFHDVDILAMPTIPYTATKLPMKDCSIQEYFKKSSVCGLNTMPFNCTGHPALNVPIGTNSNGLPIGLTLVARHYDEVRLLRVAKVIERVTCRRGSNKVASRL